MVRAGSWQIAATAGGNTRQTISLADDGGLFTPYPRLTKLSINSSDSE